MIQIHRNNNNNDKRRSRERRSRATTTPQSHQLPISTPKTSSSSSSSSFQQNIISVSLHELSQFDWWLRTVMIVVLSFTDFKWIATHKIHKKTHQYHGHKREEEQTKYELYLWVVLIVCSHEKNWTFYFGNCETSSLYVTYFSPCLSAMHFKTLRIACNRKY